MKRWLSRFRSERIRERYKAGVFASPDAGDGLWWNRPLITVAIGLLGWVSAGFLLRVGRPSVSPLAITGDFFLLLVATGIAGMMLRVLAPSVARDNTRLLTLLMCALTTLIPSGLLVYVVHGWHASPAVIAGALVPYALGPLLAAILLGESAAIVAGLWSVVSCFVIHQDAVPSLVAGLVATVTSARLARSLRRRTQVIRLGLMIGALQLSSLAAVDIGGPERALVLSKMAAACLVSGLAAALLVLLLLPLFEAISGETSNMTLLELSDLGHPLLQRLAFEAPGTYHHSLTLANLAHAAADAIGANSVLSRAGAYYHDIGKVTKPGYFTENIRAGETPHDDLTPSMSAMLVMAHVKEGVTLALLHRLPRPLIDMIQQHHGSGLVVYFHHKAGQQACSDPQQTGRQRSVDESSYRYSGPKPSSREAAIVMLADGVEAASRSLVKATPAAIVELVDQVVDAKFEDRQLDQCPMTLEELNKIKISFVFSLSNILHTRVAYPKA